MGGVVTAPLELRYSKIVLARARNAVSRDLVLPSIPGTLTPTMVGSMKSGSDEGYAVTLLRDDTGRTTGARCTCRNGQTRSLATCYHAAAAEMVACSA